MSVAAGSRLRAPSWRPLFDGMDAGHALVVLRFMSQCLIYIRSGPLGLSVLVCQQHHMLLILCNMIT